MLRLVLAFSILTGCAASGDPADDPRYPLGKEDSFGTCATAAGDLCGGKSEGNCWCDSACAGHGDCCSDKADTCPGGAIFATYNAGLAHGAVPFANERVQPLVDEIKESTADVLCMQEVWTDADADAISEGVKNTFPHAFREKTKNDANDWFACGVTQWTKLFAMNSCVSNKCTPSGISAFECAADQCAAEWNAMSDTCKLCLSANTTSPIRCAAWRAPMYGNDGRNGLLLLSREPLEKVAYTAFDTAVIKRGVITAEVNGYNVQCTHMTADLNVVPYPKDRAVHSWAEEHDAEVATLARLADRKKTILLGDLNAGPATAGVDGELPNNFDKIVAAGYRDTWLDAPVCTYCQDNPLACSKPGGCVGGLSSRLDHIMFKNFEDSATLELTRWADQPITIKDDKGVAHDGRLSDHYGVIGSMPF